jgi:transposase
MSRSHVWVPKGEEYVEPRAINWGDNLTMIGAIRRRRWVTLGTHWRGTTHEKFQRWVRRRLAPQLRPGDVVLMDRLAVHRTVEVRQLIEARGALLRLLPPYSPDLNPIEPAWGLVKKRLRTIAPRTGRHLRTAVHRARHVITATHCQRWFTHAGYVKSTANRD